MSFPCTKCGLCCKNISNITQLSKFNRGDGVCKYYNENLSECSIYNQRPVICRIDKYYELCYKDNMLRDEYYKLNADVCNKLQEINGLPIKYRVMINEIE